MHTVSVAAYDEDTVHVEFAPVDGEGEGTAVVVEGAYTLGQHLVQVNVNQELVVVQSHGRSGSNMSLRYKGSPLDVAVRSQEEQKCAQPPAGVASCLAPDVCTGVARVALPHPPPQPGAQAV